MSLRTASFFAGVGGIDLAFEQAGFNVVWANEFDMHAAKTYRANFKHCPLVVEDIRKVPTSDIPDFDVMVAGFPCQAFSVAGYRKGFGDDRGNLFFELERVFLEKRPQAIFLENVKNLAGHDCGNTFRVIREHLEQAGYHIHFRVLNACEYGNIPQNRERIYICAFRSQEASARFRFPEPIPLTTKLSDIIDFHGKVEDIYYYTEERFEHYKELAKAMTSRDTLYQWRRVYVRENKSGLCPTLTANMGTGGHNVALVVTDHGFRKLTPEECFGFMGFPKTFRLPPLANGHLYKQAGNSVAVPVVRRIAEAMAKALGMPAPNPEPAPEPAPAPAPMPAPGKTRPRARRIVKPRQRG